MDNKNVKSLYKNLVKQADMGMWSGMGGQLSNRGLQWQMYQDGSFSNSKLPSDMIAQISNQRASFKESFSQFAKNKITDQTLTAFKGMIFTAFAPNFIGDDLPDGSDLSPEQQKTLDFAKKNNIVLTSNDKEDDKQIGTDFWLSFHAYAWKDQFDEEIQDVGASQSAKVSTITNPELARTKTIGFGPVIISPTQSGGFGLFIDTNSESGGGKGLLENVDSQSHADEGDTESESKINDYNNFYKRDDGLMSFLGHQSGTNMEKFFVGHGIGVSGGRGGLRPNSTNIILPDGPQGSRVQNARQIRNSGKEKNPDIINHIENQNQSIIEARKDSTLWQFMLSDDGTFFAKNRKSGDEAPLSKAIVEQIINPSMLRGTQGVAAPKMREEQKDQKAGVGNMGRWSISNKAKKAIMGDQNDPYSNPTSIAALRMLRGDIDRMRGHGQVELGGYHIVTIGPKFSNTENMGAGQTTTKPGFATPETMVNPDDQATIPVVNRGTEWLVLVDEYQESKLQSQGRKSNPKKNNSKGFKDIHMAFEYAKSRYGGETKAFDIGERTATEAMKALEGAMNMDIDQNIPAPKLPVVVDNNIQQTVNPQPQPANNPNVPMNNTQPNVNDNRIASSKLKKMINRFRL